MKGLDFLVPSLYRVQPSISSWAGLKNLVGAEVNDSQTPEKACQNITRWIDKNEPKLIRTQSDALKLLAANDLKKMINDLQKEGFNQPSENYLATNLEQMVFKVRKTTGIDFEVPLFLVDDFPPPFNGMPWSLFNADKSDAKEFGINFGIYCKKKLIKPLQTIAILAHEVIHVAIGTIDNSGELLARGLEEGIADFIGTGWLLSEKKEYPPQVIESVIYWSRFSKDASQYWRLYGDYVRQAAYLYEKIGLAGLIDLIKSGRYKIKQVESNLMSGNLSELALSGGRDRNNELDIISSRILAIPTHLIVSPLAKYIYDRLDEPVINIKNFLSGFDIDPEQSMEALRELQQRAMLILMDESNIVAHDKSIIDKDIDLLRYELFGEAK